MQEIQFDNIVRSHQKGTLNRQRSLQGIKNTIASPRNAIRGGG